MKKTRHVLIILFAFVFSSQALAITFTIGTKEFNPPFVMKTASQAIYGFDVSLTNYICKKMDITCRYKSVNFKDLLPAIQSGEIDLGVSSLVITKDRKQKVDFTIPYMLSYGSFLIRSDDKFDPNDTHFLDNKRVGILGGSVYIEYVKNLHAKNMTRIISKNRVLQIDNLMRHKVDVAVLDKAAAVWWARNSHGLIKLFKEPFKIGEGLGIAVSKKNLKYVAKLNQAIMDWEQDGSFKKMYDVYFNMPTKIAIEGLPPLAREILKLPNRQSVMQSGLNKRKYFSELK
jgi:ABC-type amino acid transport substrate-binding protein